jgi:hypothetical protein
MRIPPILCVAVTLAAVPALAAPQPTASAHKGAPGPKELGAFDDWIAATYEQNGQTVCYAFTRAKSTQPAAGAAAPILTVTERPGSRDEVAITSGFAYPKDAVVTLQVNQAGLDFYTSGKDAFARENRSATSAFQRGSQAIARGPGPHAVKTTYTFSLQGFSAAYAAIQKACPGR